MLTNTQDFKRFIFNPSETSMWAWLETPILTFLVLGLCFFANPHNPFFMNTAFPWPWVAAIIIVLKYGFGCGIFSAVIISAAMLLHKPIGLSISADMQNYILSGFFIILLCALFSSSWARRVNIAEALSLHNAEIFNSLSRAYYLLRVSYNYIEQDLIIKPTTIRGLMNELEKMLVHHEGQLTSEIGSRFMQLIGNYCNISQAGIYLAQQKTVSIEPISTIGAKELLDKADPLIHHALQSEDIIYIDIKQLQDMNKTHYLAAFPLLDPNGNFLGILVIKEMSFWTLNHETLNIIAILLDYFLESIADTKNLHPFLKIYPNCPTYFAKELKKLINLHKKIAVESALVAIRISSHLREQNVTEAIKQSGRSLEPVWQLTLDNGDDVLITLLPFATYSTIKGYLERIQQFLKINFGLSLDQQQHLKSRMLQISNDDANTTINKLLALIKEA